MATDKYIYNTSTERYEVHKTSVAGRLGRIGICLAAGALLLALFFFLNGRLFKVHTPKQMLLQSRNARLIGDIEYLGQKTARQMDRLSELELRDNKVYRPIFGMDEIPSAERNAGYGGAGRYDFVQQFRNSAFLADVLRMQDVVERKAVMQSKSYDDVEKMAGHIDDMSKCVPSIFPVCPGPGITITSPFGYRLHPIFRSVFFHSGTDIGGARGTPVYATADGVVTDVKYSTRGYGNEIDIDHGFGYSTRYAHLLGTKVVRGQRVSRGDQIATMGSSGRSTGVHLHYEVLYHSQQVNPWSYFDKDIDPKEYMTLVTPADRVKR